MAFGRGSITVAITSIASSLGNRSFPYLISGGRHMVLHFFAVNEVHQLAGHLGRRWATVNLVKAPGLLVVLHKGIGLGSVMRKPFLYLLPYVIWTVYQWRTAVVANSDSPGSAAVHVIDLGTRRTRTHEPA